MYNIIVKLAWTGAVWAQEATETVDAIASKMERCEAYNNMISKAFCEGGWAMYLIALIGILALLLIFERGVSLSRLAVDKSSLN